MIGQRTTILVVVLILVGASVALAGGQGEPKTAQVLPVRYIVPGTEPEESGLVDEAITRRLAEDGVGLSFQRQWVAWDVWQQKTNVMLSTGEKYELIHIMEDWIPTATYVANGGLQPITDLIGPYGPHLLERIPQYIWDSAKIGGENYSIPVLFRDFALMDGVVTIQKQYWDKYGLPIPKTLDDLLDQTQTILQGEHNPDLRVWLKLNPTTALSVLREFDDFPFYVKDSLFMIKQDGTVSSWLESNEFRQTSAFYREMYERGITHPDLLIIPTEERSRHDEQGDWPFGLSTAQFSATQIAAEKPSAQLVDIRLYPDKPDFRGWNFLNANAVPASTDHPEAAVKFFDWLYTSNANYELLNYGIEGQHWKALPNRRYERLVDTSVYQFGDWEIGNYELVRMEESAPANLEPIMLEFNNNALTSIAAGFSFDPEPVASEYAALLAEIETSVYPVKYGVISYEDGYENMVRAMRAAGLDAVMAEFKRQFADWYAHR